jgi:hypothetical protein
MRAINAIDDLTHAIDAVKALMRAPSTPSHALAFFEVSECVVKFTSSVLGTDKKLRQD